MGKRQNKRYSLKLVLYLVMIYILCLQIKLIYILNILIFNIHTQFHKLYFKSYSSHVKNIHNY